MKKILVMITLSLSSLALTGFFHYYDLIMSDWTRLFIAVPIIYAGIHFRRTGSVAIMFIMLISQIPIMLLQYSRSPSSGVNYLVIILSVGFAGIFFGSIIGKEREGRTTLLQTQALKKKILFNSDENDLFALLVSQYREQGQSEEVEIYLFGEDGALRKWNDPDGPPLPEEHFYYEVTRSREFLVSRSVPEDPRMACSGPEDELARLSRIAVFPIEYSGSARGVIAILNSGAERFGPETVSCLSTIRQTIERSLELVEKRRTTIRHKVQREKIQDVFSSYLSRTVAEEILKESDKLDLEGKLHDVTVMFTEVANFKELLQEMDPLELIEILNMYFSAAMDTIFENDGTLDKFIGDNVMAFWGAPLPLPDCEERTVNCALALNRRMHELNREWEAAGKPRFDLCIGINSGPVVAGNIGSIRRMEYTVIGDTVNTASRIKTLSRSNNTPILVGEATYSKVKDTFEFEGSHQAAVKGKSGWITVYSLRT